MSFRQDARKRTIPLLCAFSIIIAQCPFALAGPGDINSTNDGQIVQGGTYYNTAGDKTTFVNSAGTGLHVQAGSTVVGREVDAGGALTGNGGHLHFNAPGQVVRIDGNIDVMGVMGPGATLGNGGKVTVDSAFLFQNGNIYASGANGGVVNFNVDNLTMTENARIYANSIGGGNGGNVDIQAKGAVDIAQGAIIDTSGQVIGNYNTNVIAIKGGLVNLDGILLANGGVPGANGGKVKVEATGNSEALDLDKIDDSGLFNGAERSELAARDNLRNTMDGSIRTGADSRVSVNGADGLDGAVPMNGGNGGVIEFTASNSISNNGVLEANGGKGGDANLVAIGDIFLKDDGLGNTWKQQESYGQTGGQGGNAGEMTFIYANTMENTGKLSLIGGAGGQGGNAEARDPKAEGHYATGGAGGQGGNGGLITTFGGGALDENSNIDLSGGAGGLGGIGRSGLEGGCDCVNEGPNGADGTPGQIVQNTEPCEPPPPPPPCTPPEETPPEEIVPPEIVPPKNGILQNDRKSPVGQVLYYNRSIFVARPAVPAVQRPPAPAVRFAQVVPTPEAPPMPAPPEKKQTVRGFW